MTETNIEIENTNFDTTQLYLVDNLRIAIETALELKPDAICFDAEGILIPFIDNVDNDEKDLSASQAITGVFEYVKSVMDNPDYSHIEFGIMTNNHNSSVDVNGGKTGTIEKLAKDYGIEHYVHSGQTQEDGSFLGKNPSGEQGIELTRRMSVDPSRAVLIDDQGWKNAGEAVIAGFMAIVAPKPLGDRHWTGRVNEHKGVMASRFVEPLVFRSLESRQRGRRARIARFAFEKVAGIDIDLLEGPFYN